MRVWRIFRETQAVDPLSGRGGLFTSGRWHTRGNRILYTAGSLSLAALEVLVHTDRDTLPSDLVQLEIDIPDKLKTSRLTIKAFPQHPDADAITIASKRPFEYDSRLSG